MGATAWRARGVTKDRWGPGRAGGRRGRVVPGCQSAERGDRRLRARETGRLGETSAGCQAAGSLTWTLCVQRGSGSSGRGDGMGSQQQRSAGSTAGALPPGSLGAAGRAVDSPRSCCYRGLWFLVPCPGLFAGRDLPSRQPCVWPRPARGRLLATPMNV